MHIRYRYLLSKTVYRFIGCNFRFSYTNSAHVTLNTLIHKLLSRYKQRSNLPLSVSKLQIVSFASIDMKIAASRRCDCGCVHNPIVDTANAKSNNPMQNKEIIKVRFIHHDSLALYCWLERRQGQ